VRGSCYSKRTDLFLVRIRTHFVQDGSGRTEYKGKVQRVVDGESHQFGDWQGLMDLLFTMASGSVTYNNAPSDNGSKQATGSE
jgi:hypothetical protein